MEILQEAIDTNPIPDVTEKKRGRKKKGKILALVERLREYKASVCLFTKNFAVPFDNNQAERDIRMINVKTKVSGCFRTKDGADDFLKIMSYWVRLVQTPLPLFQLVYFAVKKQYIKQHLDMLILKTK